MKIPELLAPGGSFDSAWQAFEAGADGVYLGLGEFSARKAAVNFTLSQLRRIRALAADRGRKIYVTLNTVIREDEMERFAETLAWLDALAVDGVIVQDLGACVMARTGFPRLPVFASTQMAVHNDLGLRMAEDLGIRRVILSRELPLTRIRALREAHPDIELEVFIHGALCYSFSGACLASWALTGRSGNRGECAQICRSLFQVDAASGRAAREGKPGRAVRPGRNACEEGHFFSCRDLALGSQVLELAAAGIDSLKIEGRMKSPEYVYHVTRLYRRILDAGEPLPPAELAELLGNAELAFSRTTTTGFLSTPRARKLIEPGFPGHRGVRLGTLSSLRGRDLFLTLERDISLHDGIGYWASGSREPLIFSLRRIQRAGRDVRHARAGDSVSLSGPEDRNAPLPAPGSEIRLFSSRFLDRPRPKEASIGEMKVPVDVSVELARGGKGCILSCVGGRGAEGFAFSGELTLDSSSGRKPFQDILTKVLGESGEWPVEATNVLFVNSTGLPDDGIFIPPSELKKLKNALYSELAAYFTASLKEKARAAARMPVQTPPLLATGLLSTLPDRDLLSPPHQMPIPFAALTAGEIRPEDCASVNGFVFVPLPPIFPDDGLWLKALARLADSRADLRLAIGLNNVSHVALAESLSARTNVHFFVDFFLYAANSCTIGFLRSRVPRLLFAYSWIEGDEESHRTLSDGCPGFPIARVGPTFRPPLFSSLGCFQRHVVGAGECRDDCPKEFSDSIRQGRNEFQLVVRDCVTWLFYSFPGDSSR